MSWRWYERLLLFCVGIGVGGFLFCAVLAGELTSSSRPVFPEPELRFTHLVKVKHSRDTVYVTRFEYLASTYGHWATLGFAVISCLCVCLLGIAEQSLSYSGHIQMACASAASMMVIYLAWHEKLL